jgi:hypothetical protein
VNKPVDHDVLRACVERYAGWSHAAATPGPFLAAGGVGSRI